MPSKVKLPLNIFLNCTNFKILKHFETHNNGSSAHKTVGLVVLAGIAKSNHEHLEEQ